MIMTDSTLNLVTIGFFIGCGYALSVVTFDLLGFAMLLTLKSFRHSLEKND